MKRALSGPKIFLMIGMILLTVNVAGCRQPEGNVPPGEEAPVEEYVPVAPFRESSDQGKDTEDPLDTDRIRIVFNPRESALTSPCDRIYLVQVLQIFLDGVPVSDREYWKSPAGMNSEDPSDVTLGDDPDTSEENEHGTRVDYGDNVRGNPGYNAPDAGEGDPGYFHGAGEGAPASDSTMEDTPSGREGVRKEFEVCAFCAKGEDCPRFFECITWIYERSHDDLNTGKRGISRITGQSNEPSAKFRKAFEKFNKVRGYNLCEEK